MVDSGMTENHELSSLSSVFERKSRVGLFFTFIFCY